ncbi:exo-beta-N-acetylmuramidase NamZ domain-containing protein [Parasediminibacterium paludis]|uniref:Exo-beta-N-acetylmuramidase NamZ domain-containing protein n=1 Tax=Parasediminibacterium paludis TaxID=908966 RepID=A0ABV8PZ88_9BACT
MRYFATIICTLFLATVVLAQPKKITNKPTSKALLPAKVILPAANTMNEYLPLLKGKRVGIFANHTATVGNTHLVDTLQKLGITIIKAFGPEHGFRGTADAGQKVDNYIDSATGIPVISLYGKKRKPTALDLADVDVMLFDIQDVGTRFYTFISSLQEFLESAIEFNKPLIILDRPNPNGFYVDGPVLDSSYTSFIGMQPIPTVYGMTIGEYAKMLIGEQMLDWKYIRMQDHINSLGEILGFEKERDNFKLTVITCKNYTHKSKYILPIKPSPNLPDMASIYWYASNCLFEGTILCEGRGTEHPFCIFGHPSLPDTLFSFTPMPTPGASSPKLNGSKCYGWNLYGTNEQVLHQINNQIQLKYLLEAYRLFPEKDSFFLQPKSKKPTDYFFNKLAGNSELMAQIRAGKSEAEIRKSWQPKLQAFKKIRKKYLLYPDFE